MRYTGYLIVFVALLQVCSFPSFADEPATRPALPKLDKAKEAYQQKAERAKADLLKDLDTKEAAARARGDKAAVDTIKSERTSFVEKNRLPKSVVVTGYESRMKAAITELEAVYTTAIKELVRTKMDDDATALQKELDALKSGADIFAGWVDLIDLADLTKHDAAVRWKKEGDVLKVDGGKNYAPLLLRYLPPEEYELQIIIDRIPGGDDCFEVGTVFGDHRCFMVIDTGGVTGIAYLDGKFRGNETMGHNHIGADPVDLRLIVKKTGVTLTADGKEVSKYTGKADRLSEGGPSEIEVGALYLSAAPNAGFHVKSLRLKVISGKGKILPVEKK